MIKESYNLIGKEHFGLKLVKQIWDLHRKKENCNVFHFRLFPAKSNDKLGQFWAIFPHFRSSKNFSQNPLLSLFSVSRFLFLCWKSEKTNEQNPRKIGCRRTDGHTHVRTHRQAWIHRTCWGSKNKLLFVIKHVCF